MKQRWIRCLAVLIVLVLVVEPLEEVTEQSVQQEETVLVFEEERAMDYPERKEEFASVFTLTSGSISLEDTVQPDQRTLSISDWPDQEETLTLASDKLMFLQGESYTFHCYFYSDLAESLIVRWGDESGTFDQSIFPIHNGEITIDLRYSHQQADTYTGWISVEVHRQSEVASGTVMLSEFRLLSSKKNHSVRINQVGYLPLEEKLAIFQANSGEIFKVVDVENEKTVFEGPIYYTGYNEETGEVNGFGDFSALTEAGRYRIEAAVNGQSYEFRIDENVYDELLGSALHMITLQRCGQDLSEAVAGIFAHEACHDDLATVYRGGARDDFTGGWHDAGDYGRYTLTTLKTVNDLLLAGWLFPEQFNDQNQSPDSGNGMLDVLDEALVGLKWLKKMQIDWGPEYTAAVTKNFASFVMPDQDQQPVFILEEENTSTAGVAGTFALASIVFASIDPGRSEELLTDAIKAYAAADHTDHEEDKKNPWDVTAGDYSNGSALDELYFAAAALYAATQDLQYLTDAAEYIKKNPDLISGLSYHEMGGYGSYLLLRFAPNDSELKKTVQKAFYQHVAGLIQMQQDNGYQVAVNGYYWGGNMFVANNAMLLLLAYDLEPDPALLHAAGQQLAYLLGRNSLNMSFVTGVGTNYPHHIHHRITEALNVEMAGALVGGPDESLESSAPPAKRYWDESEHYSTNEVTIYYNSPLVFVLAGMLEYHS